MIGEKIDEEDGRPITRRARKEGEEGGCALRDMAREQPGELQKAMRRKTEIAGGIDGLARVRANSRQLDLPSSPPVVPWANCPLYKAVLALAPSFALAQGATSIIL